MQSDSVRKFGFRNGKLINKEMPNLTIAGSSYGVSSSFSIQLPYSSNDILAAGLILTESNTSENFQGESRSHPDKYWKVCTAMLLAKEGARNHGDVKHPYS